MGPPATVTLLIQKNKRSVTASVTFIGCTPKGSYGNTEGSGEGVLRRVLRRGSAMGFTVKKGF